jgi:6-phosphogluconolactonase
MGFKRMNRFESASALAEQLAKDVGDKLASAINKNGSASLAVSGGSTPKLFFQTLSKYDINWKLVTITLVDERFVGPDNERSNHKLVADLLLQNNAKNAQFIPLYQAGASIDDAATLATVMTAAFCDPFDVVVLGMGADGHTASFFPEGDNLEIALDLDEPREVLPMAAETAGEERLTFNLSALHDARLLALHIEGEGKLKAYEAAKADLDEEEMPVRAVLNRADTPVAVYWAP